MKCIIEDNNVCRRCRRSGLPCIFIPRANAATLPESVMALQEDDFKKDVLRRLKIIEDTLGLSAASAPFVESAAPHGGSDNGEDLSPEFSSLGALWDAVVVLQRSAPSSVPTSIWRKSMVKVLWLS